MSRLPTWQDYFQQRQKGHPMGLLSGGGAPPDPTKREAKADEPKHFRVSTIVVFTVPARNEDQARHHAMQLLGANIKVHVMDVEEL